MLLAVLGVLPVAAGVIWSSPFTELGFARAGEQAWGPKQNMAHVHVCMCFCAANSAFAAAPVAEPRVTEFWLYSLVFPALMSPGCCLSLTPLLSVSLGSPFHLVLSFLLSLVCAAIPSPQERVRCTKSLFSPCVCFLQFGFCLY